MGRESDLTLTYVIPEEGVGLVDILSGYAKTSRFCNMTVDGVEYDEVQTEHIFNDAGEHTVTLDLVGGSIPDQAFANLKYLRGVRFSDMVAVIGNGAFRGVHLKYPLELPGNLTTLRSWAFRDATFPGQDSEVRLPDSLMTFGEEAIDGTGTLHVGRSLPYLSFYNLHFNDVEVCPENTTLLKKDGCLVDIYGRLLWMSPERTAVPEEIREIQANALGMVQSEEISIPGTVRELKLQLGDDCGIRRITLGYGMETINISSRNKIHLDFSDSVKDVEYTLSSIEGPVILPPKVGGIKDAGLHVTALQVPSRTVIRYDTFCERSAIRHVVFPDGITVRPAMHHFCGLPDQCVIHVRSGEDVRKVLAIPGFNPKVCVVDDAEQWRGLPERLLNMPREEYNPEGRVCNEQKVLLEKENNKVLLQKKKEMKGQIAQATILAQAKMLADVTGMKCDYDQYRKWVVASGNNCEIRFTIRPSGFRKDLKDALSSLESLAGTIRKIGQFNQSMNNIMVRDICWSQEKKEGMTSVSVLLPLGHKIDLNIQNDSFKEGWKASTGLISEIIAVFSELEEKYKKRKSAISVKLQ